MELVYILLLSAVGLLEAWVVPEVQYHRATRSGDAIVERPGWSHEGNDCDRITSVPQNLRTPEQMYPNGLDYFYQKYTQAYGIPIVGSSKVSDSALRRGCYMIRFLLADRPDARESFYKMFGRYAIMAHDEMTTAIPEHSHLDATYWDGRARGLGGTRHSPVSTGGEENALCLKEDRYPVEDIMLHELVHGIHIIGANYAIPGFKDRVKAVYNSAKAKGLWANTYAMTNEIEYFAKAAQSYFNDNKRASPPDGINNKYFTRKLLRSYDPAAYALLEELWPCKNTYLRRCLTSRTLEQSQTLRMNCAGATNNYFSYDQSCKDSNFGCPDFAVNGDCSTNPVWMNSNCPRSCRQCTTTYRMGSANSGVQSATAPLNTCSDTATGCDSTSCTTDPGYFSKVCRGTCVGCSYYLGIMNGGCSDNDNRCATMAASGQCNSNPIFVMPKCKKSCNICGAFTATGSGSTTGTGTCTDTNSNCAYWAANGECNKTPTYMTQFCKKSCNLCNVGSIVAGTVTTGRPAVATTSTSTTSSPTIATGTGTCIDSNASCAGWAAIGECTKNPNFMLNYCKKSCNTDSNTNCSSWAANGECTKNPGYMLQNCKKSCNTC